MMKYDVSVIIPFYNNDKYLEEAVNSVLNQNYNFSKIEVILINDCSIDNSLEIAKKYEKYSNVKIIDKKKNGGVSKARNSGIKEALGKYIMLLDGDDYLSKNTIKNLVSFFNDHEDEIDLVTYPIYMKVNDSRPKMQAKYEYYDKGTGIYDLDEYPYANQTTINIIFKNDKKYYFDDSLKLCEDQKFITGILMKKMKIGFCRDAKYFYRRYGGGASQTFNNFYYCYDNIINYHEWLVNSFLDVENKKLPKYIQVMILNTFSWRFRSDMLFPYFLEGKEYDKAFKRIMDLLKYVDFKTIYDFSAMSFNEKYYFIKQKTNNVKIDVKDKKLNFYVDNKILNSFKVLEANIKRNKIFNDTLYFQGILSETFWDLKKPKLYLVVNKSEKVERKELELFESRTSYNNSRIKINHVYGFDFELDLRGVQRYGLELEVDGTIFKVKCVHGNFATPKKITDKYIYNFRLKDFNYYVKKSSLKNRMKYYISDTIKNFRICPKTIVFKLLSRVFYCKKSWLYYDNNNLDNGFYQFVHDFEKNDGKQKFYVCDKKTKEKIDKKYHKYVINVGSVKHRLKYLNAEKIFVSNSSLVVYCPFKKFKKINDLINYQLIYLQHGVLHANLSFIYNKEITEIDKIAISSDFEKNNLINNYGYKEKDLILSGMPRYDLNNDKEVSVVKNKILFAPSWRIYLANETSGTKRVGNKKLFKDSSYYKNLKAFFESPRLLKLLEKNDLVIDVKLHPNFDAYNDCLDFFNDRINLIKSVDFSEYKMLITDFSSFQFDYIDYLRPMIYYIPDKAEFNAGLHTYKELDLKSDDNFADTFYDYEDVISEIERIIKSNYVVSSKFKNRMKKFFSYDKEKSCCDVIYDNVK